MDTQSQTGLAMLYATLINLGVLLTVFATLYITKNPLALFGIMLLQPMPYALLAQEPEDEPGNPIGFVHSD